MKKGRVIAIWVDDPLIDNGIISNFIECKVCYTFYNPEKYDSCPLCQRLLSLKYGDDKHEN